MRHIFKGYRLGIKNISFLKYNMRHVFQGYCIGIRKYIFIENIICDTYSNVISLASENISLLKILYATRIRRLSQNILYPCRRQSLINVFVQYNSFNAHTELSITVWWQFARNILYWFDPKQLASFFCGSSLVIFILSKTSIRPKLSVQIFQKYKALILET